MDARSNEVLQKRKLMPQNLIHSCCLSEDELDILVDILLKNILEFKVITFEANLGAGKTTLIRKIIQYFNKQTHVKSPSFNIVNEYFLDNKKIFHFDLYRIQNEDELDEIGFSEYIENGDLTLIEWPQKAQNKLNKFILVKINNIKNKREYLVYKN